MATAGEPFAINWNYQQGIFHYRFKADSGIAAPTVIYLPAERFGPKSVITTTLRFEFKYEEQRLLIYNDGCGGEAEVICVCL